MVIAANLTVGLFALVTSLKWWWPIWDFGRRKSHQQSDFATNISKWSSSLSHQIKLCHQNQCHEQYVPKIRSLLLRLQTWPILSIRLRRFAQTCEFVSISEIPFWLRIDSFHLVPFMPIWQSIHDQQTVQIDHQFGNALIKLCCLDNSNRDFCVKRISLRYSLKYTYLGNWNRQRS